MELQFQAGLQGFLIAFGLISAIGAQNAFVIKQAIKKEHTLAVCVLCVACDAVLMSVGVLGFGGFLARSIIWSKILALLGAVFLCYYGALSFRAAFASHRAIDTRVDTSHSSLKSTLISCLIITLFNPHVYLDTIVLLGGIGVSVDSKFSFLLGCVSASAVWFALLGLGSNALSPYLSSPRAWRILEGIVGCVMFGIALSLVIFVVRS